MGAILRINAQNDDSRQFDCPSCQKTISVPADRLHNKYRFRLKCFCKHVFEVTIEMRDMFRKKTLLDGKYQILRKPNHVQNPGADVHWKTHRIRDLRPNCRIIDISRRGLGLQVSHNHSIQPEDRLEIHFRLDNSARTEIIRQCIVKHVHGKTIFPQHYCTASFPLAIPGAGKAQFISASWRLSE